MPTCTAQTRQTALNRGTKSTSTQAVQRKQYRCRWRLRSSVPAAPSTALARGKRVQPTWPPKQGRRPQRRTQSWPPHSVRQTSITTLTHGHQAHQRHGPIRQLVFHPVLPTPTSRQRTQPLSSAAPRPPAAHCGMPPPFLLRPSRAADNTALLMRLPRRPCPRTRVRPRPHPRP